MRIEFLPLLQIQRDLYKLPRGIERFREYLRTMQNEDGSGLNLPLVAMNPMGKEHVAAYLDQLMALDAEAIVQDALHEMPALPDSPPLRLGLVLSDDALGGWTNRTANEFIHIVSEPIMNIKYGFVTPILWTGDIPSIERVRGEVLATIHRYAYVVSNGEPKTLLDILRQEGHALKGAHVTQWLDTDDLAYTHEVLAGHLHAVDQPTLIAALFGDEAARDLGYQPLGLSARAGLGLALNLVANAT